MIRAYHIIVRGRVQGVGFRYFAHREAKRLGLCGFVKNLISGDVEIIAEGTEENIKIFKAALKEGPHYGEVTELVAEQIPSSQGYKSFEVHY